MNLDCPGQGRVYVSSWRPAMWVETRLPATVQDLGPGSRSREWVYPYSEGRLRDNYLAAMVLYRVGLGLLLLAGLIVIGGFCLELKGPSAWYDPKERIV